MMILLLIKSKSLRMWFVTPEVLAVSEKRYQRFLYELESIINQRIDENVEGSYTSKLYQRGINKVAQKWRRSRTVIEAKDSNDELFKNEATDLLYHF